MKKTYNEALEQKALFQWASLLEGKYRELSLLHHIPNGGRRSALEGARLKSEGVKAGVPDICLPVARGEYHGLYIELKVGKNKPSEKQQQWITRLREQGYDTVVCYGWEAAAEHILDYLKKEKSCKN